MIYFVIEKLPRYRFWIFQGSTAT